MIFDENFSFLYKNLRKNISTKILQKTKDLSLSRDKYNSFIDTQNKSQGKIDYKLPKIKMKHSISQNNINQKNENNMNIKIFPYKSKNPFTNTNLKSKQIQHLFFLSELIENDKKNENEVNKSNIVKLKRIKFPRTIKNKNKIDFNIFKNIKKKEQEKQIFILIDSIFSDQKIVTKDTQLKYEEENIFGHKDKYLSYLRKELYLLHKGEKELENKTNINFDYDNRIYGKIKLELTSANILVTNKETNEECYSIDIPLNMMCLFYLSQIKELIYIVLGFFSKENFMENEQQNLLSELKDIIKNQISFENYILKYKHNIDDEDRKIIFDDYLNRRNIKNRSNVKYNILSLFSKKEAFKQIIFQNCTYTNSININSNIDNNTNENLAQNSNNNETLKILFNTNINIINFSWITLNNNYNIKITLPQIVIYINKFKKEINHFICRELFTYLLMNDFKNFDFYAIHYLFS